MKKLLFLVFLFLFLSPKNLLFNNTALAVDAPTKPKAVVSCEKDAKTGQFTVSTITFTWDSAYGNTEDYFQTNGMPNEVDVGRGAQNEGGNYSTVLPSLIINNNSPLPYNTTYQWHVRTHDTGTCLFGCDATTNGPQVTSKDCTIQPLPSDTYDCDTGSYACVKHTGTGNGSFATQGQCQNVCIKPPSTYNYTCENRDPKCSDLTQFPQSKCTDFFDKNGVPAAQWSCPVSPDGCPMTNATVTPNTHSCALSKDYVCNPTGAEGDTCYVLGCAGPVQGTCKTGLFCDRTGASALDPGTCKKTPADFGTLCYTCITGEHWVGSDTNGSCVDTNGQPDPNGKGATNYCNVNGSNNETCQQGNGCVSGTNCPFCNPGTEYSYYYGQCLNPSTGQYSSPREDICPADQCIEGFGCKGGQTQPTGPPLSLCGDISANGSCSTAIGPLPTLLSGLLTTVFSIALSIAGVVALALIIISGYRLMISQGNPEQVKGAREQLTAAIVGLLFIIFSLVILQVISANILNIPGFG